MLLVGIKVYGESSPPGFIPIVPLPNNDHCIPYAISGDGNVIVGECPWPNQIEAFYYTVSEGIVGMGLVPGAYGSTARAVSEDGSVIVGWHLFLEPGEFKGFRWTKTTGYDPLPPVPGRVYQRATGIAGNVSIIVGSASNDLGENEVGFRWTSAEGIVELGSLPPNPPSTCRAAAISANGTYIAGFSDPWEDSHRPIRWTSSSGSMLGLGTGPGTLPTVQAISGDGTVVVGSKRWRASNGWFPEEIPNIDVAFSISKDGSSIVGRGWAGVGSQVAARVWSEPCGTKNLRDLLLSAGLAELNDWQLNIAFDVADDNRSIVGVGVNGQGQTQGFLARLPMRGDLTFDGRVNVIDLLEVINMWGPCPTPATCTFKDVNCDGVINHVDLLAVIESWNP